MEIASQITLLIGLTVLGAGLVVAFLGRLMMSSTETGNSGVIREIVSIFAGAGVRVGGWLVMSIGAVISIVAGVMHLFGS